MRLWRMRASAVALFLGLFAPAVRAALMEGDHPIFGPASVTIDTATGLRWLDITLTTNRSFNDISIEFGPGGDFEGFRHASVAELVSLWNAAGIPCAPTLACEYNEGPVGGDPPNAGADILMPLVGWTLETETTFVAEGIIADEGPIVRSVSTTLRHLSREITEQRVVARGDPPPLQGWAG